MSDEIDAWSAYDTVAPGFELRDENIAHHWKSMDSEIPYFDEEIDAMNEFAIDNRNQFPRNRAEQEVLENLDQMSETINQIFDPTGGYHPLNVHFFDPSKYGYLQTHYRDMEVNRTNDVIPIEIERAAGNVIRNEIQNFLNDMNRIHAEEERAEEDEIDRFIAAQLGRREARMDRRRERRENREGRRRRRRN